MISSEYSPKPQTLSPQDPKPDPFRRHAFGLQLQETPWLQGCKVTVSGFGLLGLGGGAPDASWPMLRVCALQRKSSHARCSVLSCTLLYILISTEEVKPLE